MSYPICTCKTTIGLQGCPVHGPAHPLPDVGEVENGLRDLLTWLHESDERHKVLADALALIASLKEKHAETRGLVRDLTACLENRNKEIANLKADVERLTGERDGLVDCLAEAMIGFCNLQARLSEQRADYETPNDEVEAYRRWDRIVEPYLKQRRMEKGRAKPNEERHG